MAADRNASQPQAENAPSGGSWKALTVVPASVAWLVLLALKILRPIVGMPLDLPPAILLLGPIFGPLATAMGIDPVQLDLVVIINLGIGSTRRRSGRPVISSSIARSSLGEAMREFWPSSWSQWRCA